MADEINTHEQRWLGVAKSSLKHLLCGWLAAAGLGLSLTPSTLEFVEVKDVLTVNKMVILLGTLGFFCIFTLLARFLSDSYCLALAATCFACPLILRISTPEQFCGVLLLIGVFIYHVLPGFRAVHKLQKEAFSRICRCIIVVTLLGFLSYKLFLIFTQPNKEIIDNSNLKLGLLSFPLMYILLPLAFFIIIYMLLPQRGKFVMSRGKMLAGIIVVAAIQIYVMGVGMIARYYTFSSGSFDFGLFVQMFHSMVTDGSLNTTLERGELMSHFAVHVSPVYYLLAPFYALWPSGGTLNFLQVIVTASGIIPLYKLCRHKNFSNGMTLFMAFLYFFNPALSGSHCYDIHENCFLAPFLLWLFYALEKENTFGIFLTAFLTLTVKEDAALYIGTIGLWQLFEKKYKRGATLILLSIAGYAIDMVILNSFGTGDMTQFRFGALTAYEKMGLIGFIPTLFLGPAYFILSVFSIQKFTHLLQMFLPLAFVPLLQLQHKRRLILLIPIIVMHYWTTYGYQYNLYFQYGYGTSVILLYLTVLFWSEVREVGLQNVAPHSIFSRKVKLRHHNYENPFVGKGGIESLNAQEIWGAADVVKDQGQCKVFHAHGRKSAATALIIISLFFSATICTKVFYDNVDYVLSSFYSDHQSFKEIHQFLRTVPEDASVICSDAFTLDLGRRKICYELNKQDTKQQIIDKKPDFIVLDMRYTEQKVLDVILKFKEKEYGVFSELEGKVLILKRNQ